MSLVTCGFPLVLCLVAEAAAQQIPDNEYALIGYEEAAVDNPVARLSARLQSGEVKLQYRGHRGYLDSLLEALEIDPGSQVLVFSPTSLQYQLISPRTPRALYFNDETYVGWVRNSNVVEIVSFDGKFGTVFYIFNNVLETKQYFDRTNQRCLVCHDTYGTMGGGVPLILARSSIYSKENKNLREIIFTNTTDQSPIADRWGGWYVTGQHGRQKHFGNVILSGPEELSRLEQARRGNLDTLAELDVVEIEPYLRPTSDIVALMVLEHQLSVQNQLTYVRFKAPIVMARMGLADAAEARSWDALPQKSQRVLTRMLDQLVQNLLLVDAAPFEDRISGSPEYETWFQSQGPRDELGRSLRELDLNTRLFKYPLSFLIYSNGFDQLQDYAKDYVYRQLAAILEGRDGSETYRELSPTDRRAILEILAATKADFTPYLNQEKF